jgi:hypothetical protein
VVARALVGKGTSSRRGAAGVGTLALGKATPQRRKKLPVNREYVGIDLHRRRSVIIRKSDQGELLSKVHIDNDPLALMAAVDAAGPEPEVVLEATFGWVRHEAPCDRVGCKDPPAACAFQVGSWIHAHSNDRLPIAFLSAPTLAISDAPLLA